MAGQAQGIASCPYDVSAWDAEGGKVEALAGWAIVYETGESRAPVLCQAMRGVERRCTTCSVRSVQRSVFKGHGPRHPAGGSRAEPCMTLHCIRSGKGRRGVAAAKGGGE